MVEVLRSVEFGMIKFFSKSSKSSTALYFISPTLWVSIT